MSAADGTGNLFDFGSANRNEGGYHGVNTKGLVTFDRGKKKDAFFFYKANWNPEPLTYVTSRRYVDRAYPFADVKVYSNADDVELLVNSESIGRRSSADCPQRTCMFARVALRDGRNVVTAAGRHGTTTTTDSVEWSVVSRYIAIAAGYMRSGYFAADDRRFGSDYFFAGGTGGQIDSGDAEGGIPAGIRGTREPQLYKYHRRGDFAYAIPRPEGRYRITLGFLEPDRRAKRGDRLFTITANGVVLASSFDVVREAGAPLTAVTRTFSANVTGGRLVLDFAPEKGEAIVSTIIVEAAP